MLTGVSLKSKYYQEVLNQNPDISFFEIHPENYMHEGGIDHFFLEKIAQEYPISMHGVSLSLGSADGLNVSHVKRLKTLVDRYNPCFVSEHISWSRIGGTHMNDLLPLPYTQESLTVLSDSIKQTQDILGRQIFVENPSSYVMFKESTMTEPEFISSLLEKSECQLLLDVNNIYVSAHNIGFKAESYIKQLTGCPVGEIHLADHVDEDDLKIDTHSGRVRPEVWSLYSKALDEFGSVPTLIEWDSELPDLSVLLDEARKAKDLMTQAGKIAC